MFTQARQSAINRQVRKSLILSSFPSCLYYCIVPRCRNHQISIMVKYLSLNIQLIQYFLLIGIRTDVKDKLSSPSPTYFSFRSA